MKRLLLAVLLLGPAVGLAAPRTYQLDPEHLALAFLTEHIGYAKVLGTFSAVSGSYVYDDATDTLSNLRIVVETRSVDTGHARRDDHLRSDDFLSVQRFPHMTFTAQGARTLGSGRYEIAGQLTLRGVTKPLTLAATLNRSAPYPIGDKAHVMGVSARGSLKRSEFGMTYGVADGLVGDVVELIIEIEARRQ